MVSDGEGEALCEVDWEGEVVGDDPKEGVLSMVSDALALSEREALADWVAYTVGEGLSKEVEVRVANKEAVGVYEACETEAKGVGVTPAVLESTQLMEALEERDSDRVGDELEDWQGVMEEVKECVRTVTKAEELGLPVAIGHWEEERERLGLPLRVTEAVEEGVGAPLPVALVPTVVVALDAREKDGGDVGERKGEGEPVRLPEAEKEGEEEGCPLNDALPDALVVADRHSVAVPVKVDTDVKVFECDTLPEPDPLKETEKD